MKAKSIVLSAAFLLFGACASNNPRSGLDEIGELSSRIEQVRGDADLAKQRVDAAIKSLQSITRADFKGDAAAAFVEFVTAVDASTQQAGALHESVATMKEEAAPLFKKWEEGLAAFSSEQMRTRSKERQQKTRERFDAIVTTSEAAQVACDALNVRLHDHVAYLRYDFNPAALALIAGEVNSLAQGASALSTQLTACQDAAKAYVEAASMPKAGASPKQP
jgi:hypothetical protein